MATKPIEGDMTKAIAKVRRTAITAASIDRMQAQVEHTIATAFEPDEVLKAYDMAAACKLLAKQVDASRSVQNRCAASHTKAVRKVGEVTQRLREDGVLAKRGGDKTKVTLDDNGNPKSREMTLDDLGISRNIAAAGIKLLSLTPDEIDTKASEATEQGKDFSCKRCVSEVREEATAAKRSSEKAEAKKRRRNVDGLYHGDFREIGDKIPDASVDLIFTDPPYDRKAIELFDGLGEFASRVLRPGGSLVAYIGQIQLPDAVADLSRHLRYWWTCSCYHSGPTLLRMNEYGIVNGWKPMLWFVKETRGDKLKFINDVATGSREKSHHEWQQSEQEARYFIEHLTDADGFVVDPFCGGGTTPAACIGLGRKWAAFEIDEANLARASERISEVSVARSK
jgi:site-specific DNA-methyltransferase (adenine-specific)